MKKILFASLALPLFLVPTAAPCMAEEVELINYQLFDENENLLTERVDIEVGDKFIDKNFNEFEVYLVDKTQGKAKAKFVRTYERPKISKKSEVSPISSKPKKIALYMTHNDESYLIGDGYDSIYGAGGIHDVAKALKSELSKKGVNVELNETLHVPHNSSAYTRSNTTAKALLKNSPDAIFDIHRDGTSRNYYLANVNGKERSKVRIVLGQSNSNSAANLQFAMYLMSVAEIDYPWLFHDIYWGKGHYNQALSNKALLFEMGTHTIEKDYVLETTTALADVINTCLYGTKVDNENNLIVGDNNGNTVNENLNTQTNVLPIILIPSALGGAAIVATIIISCKKTKKSKKK